MIDPAEGLVDLVGLAARFVGIDGFLGGFGGLYITLTPDSFGVIYRMAGALQIDSW